MTDFRSVVVVGPAAAGVADALGGPDGAVRVVESAENAGAELVVVAAGEQRDDVAGVLADVVALVDASVVVAVCTATLPVTDLAAAVPEPRRIAGLHVVDSVPGTSLVEVVRALQTSPETVTALTGFCTSIGKTPVEVEDRPGFLINKLLMPYLNDVIQAYDDELASAEDLDVALELGLGYRMGPMKLLDAIGLDTHHHATRSAYQATMDPQFAPPPLLSRMVAAGYLGNKSGRGFRAGGGIEGDS